MSVIQLASLPAALCSNLTLLGFDRGEFRVDIAPEMFARSNDSAMCTLLYVLLREIGLGASLNRAWPIVDNATKRSFRRAAVDALETMEARGALPRGRYLVSLGLLRAASGPRLIELLWRLSSSVLATRFAAEFPNEAAAAEEEEAAAAAAVRSQFLDERSAGDGGDPTEHELHAVRACVARERACAARDVARLSEVRCDAAAERDAIARARVAVAARGQELFMRSRALDAARGERGRKRDAASRARERDALRGLSARWAEIERAAQSSALRSGIAAMEAMSAAPKADAPRSPLAAARSGADPRERAVAWAHQLDNLAAKISVQRQRRSAELLRPEGAVRLGSTLAGLAEANELLLQRAESARRDFETLAAEAAAVVE